jgi:hypothetical protein
MDVAGGYDASILNPGNGNRLSARANSGNAELLTSVVSPTVHFAAASNCAGVPQPASNGSLSKGLNFQPLTSTRNTFVTRSNEITIIAGGTIRALDNDTAAPDSTGATLLPPLALPDSLSWNAISR